MGSTDASVASNVARSVRVRHAVPPRSPKSQCMAPQLKSEMRTTMTKIHPDQAGAHQQDPPSHEARVDAAMAGAVLGVLKADVLVPMVVTAKVHGGSVTLQGQVTWEFERGAAERAIRKLKGVLDVRNFIVVMPRVSPVQVSNLVFAALEQHTPSDAKSIHVDTLGSEVTLTGTASSWQSILDAENAAWAAPGVAQVLDQVKFSPKPR